MKKIFILGIAAGLSTLCCIAADSKNSLEEMRQVYQKAELAMRCKNYSKAREAYLLLLQTNVTSCIDIFSYADICIRLSFAEKELGLLDEAENRVTKLLQRPLPDDSYLRAKLLQAKILQEQNKPEEAYFLLKELQSKFPFEVWPSEEKAYFVAVEQIVSERYQLQLSHAKRLFDASLFHESGILYQDILQKVETNKYPSHARDSLKLVSALAKAHFSSKNYSKVITLLQPKALSWDQEDIKNCDEIRDILFLLARSYKEVGNGPQACSLFEKLVSKREETPHEILLERAASHALLGDSLLAKDDLLFVISEAQNSRHLSQAKIQLAKILLKEQSYEDVEKLLNDELLLHPTHYECAFLIAESAYFRHLYEKAAFYFDKAIPKRNKDKAEWAKNALYHKGLALLKANEIAKAEQVFKELHNDPIWEERANLGIASVLLLQKEQLHSEQAAAELDELLNDSTAFPTLEGCAEALALRAKATPSFETKIQLYKKLTEMPPYNTTLAGKRSWYFRSLHTYLTAEEMRSKGDPNASLLYCRACQLFEKSFLVLENVDKELASLSLLLLAECLSVDIDKANDSKAIDHLDTLISSNLFIACPKKEEALYLHGMLCMQLFNLEDDEVYLTKAHLSLMRLALKFAANPLSEKGLFALGCAYYKAEIYDKAEECFSALAKNIPSSPLAAESLFYAAFCAEKSEDEGEQNALVYRSQVVDHYKTSPFAGECYLRLFSFSEYVRGEKEPLMHLLAMQEFYPNSPMLIIASYLLGLEAKEEHDLESALPHLENAITLFEQHRHNGSIIKEQFLDLVKIVYRAKIEYATIALQSGSHIEQALTYLKSTIDAFATPDHPLSKDLLATHAYPRLLEESEYLLARLCEPENAKEVLNEMFRKYKALGITKSYYLALAHFELGKLFAKENDHSKALAAFKEAEEASRPNLLGSEQKLQIWTYASHSARALGNFDEAMLFLSYVINENVSSSIRIQAMLLRSELYALQGRHELAVKQLEAIARKGGEFALLAKEKLKENYGFE